MTPPTDSEMVAVDSGDRYLLGALVLLALASGVGFFTRPELFHLVIPMAITVLGAMVYRLNQRIVAVLYRRTKSRKLQAVYSATHQQVEE